MNKEIIRLLDIGLSAGRDHPMEDRRRLAVMQAAAWLRLGGRWVSDIPAEDEIAAITLANGASLVTGNRRHCERIESLRIENWIRE